MKFLNQSSAALLPLALLSLLTSLASAETPIQATFFVAPNGVGSAATKDAPSSLNGVRDLVRKMTGNMRGDIIVYLRGGTYSLTAPFQLQESAQVHDSGSNGFNVIYEAFPGETPILSGES